MWEVGKWHPGQRRWAQAVLTNKSKSGSVSNHRTGSEHESFSSCATDHICRVSSKPVPALADDVTIRAAHRTSLWAWRQSLDRESLTNSCSHNRTRCSSCSTARPPSPSRAPMQEDDIEIRSRKQWFLHPTWALFILYESVHDTFPNTRTLLNWRAVVTTEYSVTVMATVHPREHVGGSLRPKHPLASRQQ